MADDFVSKALAGAKTALSNANNFSKSAGDAKGQFAPPSKKTVVDSAPPKKPSTGIAREAEDAGKGIKARMENEGAALGSMKKGGKVPKTGLYQLHKDETVVPAEAAKALGGKKKSPKPKMDIEPTDNEGYVVRHNMKGEDGMPVSKTHAIKNDAELLAHVKDTYQGADASQSQEPAEG